MKKFLWSTALVAALALVVMGCPGEGDPEPPPGEGDGTAQNWYLATDDDGAKAPNNRLTLQAQEEDHYMRIFFDAPGKDFDKIKIDFTLNPGANVSWQSVWTGKGENKTTWGQSGNDYIDFLESGPIEVNPATMFTSKWAGPAANLVKGDINFICIRVSVPDDPSVFTLTGVSFTGMGSGSPPPTPPPENDGPIVIFDGSDGGFISGASLKPSDTATATANNITVAWNPDGSDNGEFRAEVQLATTAQADLSDYTKFVMDWTAGSGTSGSFNISLYFSGNRMLSKTVSSGTASFDFTSDHPSWADGTEWGGAAVGTITGFEIYSGDDTSFGSGNLIITRISFE